MPDSTDSTDIYQQQRSILIARQDKFLKLLPESCPAMPADITALSHADMFGLLHESANSHSSLQIIIGWGDGTIPFAILEDAMLREKHTILLVLKGEEDAFAASMQTPFLSLIAHGEFHIVYYQDSSDLNLFFNTHFGQHSHIPKLAGCEIIDHHPLCAAAEQTRQEMSAPFLQCLADQPYHYGNDIYDGFLGIEFSSHNARSLLPAPTIGEMKAFFGDRPVISIAAGPSLQNHLDELRALQHHCVLVACDAVLPGLIAAGIEPHFVTPLERTEQAVKFLSAAQGTRTIFAGLPVIPPAGVAYFEDRCVAVYAGDAFYKWLLPDNDLLINTGTSTGVLSFTLASILGTGDIYLVGHDLSTGTDSTHWVGAGEAASLLATDSNEAERLQGVMSGYEERQVLGNSGEQVTAIAWWDRFRREIEVDVRNLNSQHRRVINININQRVGAHIDGCVAGDLPHVADLTPMDPIILPTRKPERYSDWQQRIAVLEDDIDLLVEHVTSTQKDIAAMKKTPPADWDIQTIADKLTLSDIVSAGNKDAFEYFLRSALHNSNAEMHMRRITPSQARFKWQALNTMDMFCESMIVNMEYIRPKIKGLVNEHAN